MKQLFGNDIQERLKTTYLSVLKALKNKNIDFLKANLEDLLTKNIKF